MVNDSCLTAFSCENLCTSFFQFSFQAMTLALLQPKMKAVSFRTNGFILQHATEKVVSKTRPSTIKVQLEIREVLAITLMDQSESQTQITTLSIITSCIIGYNNLIFYLSMTLESFIYANLGLLSN